MQPILGRLRQEFLQRDALASIVASIESLRHEMRERLIETQTELHKRLTETQEELRQLERMVYSLGGKHGTQ